MKIFYKYEGTSPSGSHKTNTAVPQAYYNAEAGAIRGTSDPPAQRKLKTGVETMDVLDVLVDSPFLSRLKAILLSFFRINIRSPGPDGLEVNPREAGTKKITTETGAGQWGSALAWSGSQFGVPIEVYQVKASTCRHKVSFLGRTSVEHWEWVVKQ